MLGTFKELECYEKPNNLNYNSGMFCSQSRSLSSKEKVSLQYGGGEGGRKEGLYTAS